jgi:hypothetical protein
MVFLMLKPDIPNKSPHRVQCLLCKYLSYVLQCCLLHPRKAVCKYKQKDNFGLVMIKQSDMQTLTDLCLNHRAFTGKYNKNSEAGTYSCIVCHEPLFTSETKFDSGCGWPAFNDVLDQGKVKLTKDMSHGKLIC